MEKALGWVHKLGGTESLGISKEGQTVSARLMESQIWHQPTSSVAPWGEDSEKGQWPLPAFLSSSSCLDASHFTSSLYATVPFKLLPWCWSSERISLSKSEWVPQEELFWTPTFSSTDSMPTVFLQPKVMGTYLSGAGTLDWVAWCGAGTSHSWDIPPEFLSTTCECMTSPFHTSLPLLPVWMDVVSLIL